MKTLVIITLLIGCYALCCINLIQLDNIDTKLDNIHTIDTIYVDVDDMSQADWKAYTQHDSITE